MSYSTEDTIFIQIASYRDSELQHTLQDLFKKAKKPENIFVGICHQYDIREQSDKHLFELPFPRPKQLRIDEIDYRDSGGCCWARNRVQKLWNGEKWTLMIDSHMRFEESWDEILVTMCKNLGKKYSKPVLSSYTSGYDHKTGKVKGDNWTHVVMKCVIKRNELIFHMRGEGKLTTLEAPTSNPFMAGGFCFADSKIIEEVPYDPEIFFFGEQIAHSVKLWTKGWNIFIPNKSMILHLYNSPQTSYRPLNIISERNKVAFCRVWHLLNAKKSQDIKVLKNLEDFSTGSQRTLRDYERFAGINFRKIQMREKARIGAFEEWREVSKIDTIKRIFKDLRKS